MGRAKPDSVAKWPELSPGFVYRAGRLGVIITNSFPNMSHFTQSRIGDLGETWALQKGRVMGSGVKPEGGNGKK